MYFFVFPPDKISAGGNVFEFSRRENSKKFPPAGKTRRHFHPPSRENSKKFPPAGKTQRHFHPPGKLKDISTRQENSRNICLLHWESGNICSKSPKMMENYLCHCISSLSAGKFVVGNFTISCVCLDFCLHF